MPTPSKVTVDFSNVEDRREGGRAAHVPEGDYLLQVVGCELKSKKDDSTSKYLSWRTNIVEPTKHKGAGSIWYTTSLKAEHLWNLRNFLEDLGIKVEKKALDIPIAKIVAKKPIFGATLADDEYNGKIKSIIAATFKKSAFEVSEESEDEEETEAESSDDEEEEVDEIDLEDDL